jgi:hypothetical protein
MARCTKITTGTGTVTATLLANGSASTFYGVSALSAEAASFYIKLYWEGTGTAPPPNVGASQPATVLPSAGTTIATMTFLVPTTGLPLSATNVPINNGGRIWYWISATAADGAQSALTTGGDLVTLIYD